ncbi:hypothetical protein G9A89_009392 [Geosiphon pyriformis]|nr:hypothetical protein G9A89_009392 [Geosiphon pyriformis]
MQVKAKENYKYQQIESPTNLSYHYTSRSTINIASAGTSISNALTFEQFPFQSKQKKEDLLGLYGTYFKKFKSRSPMPSGNPDIRTLNFQTQQDQNLENPEIGTPPNQNDQNPDLINQQNLPPNIIIDHNQFRNCNNSFNHQYNNSNQLSQWFLHQSQNLRSSLVKRMMPKHESMTLPKPSLQIIEMTQEQYNLAQKPQNFDAFKIEFLRYFSDNNSINCLASTFTTLKQEDTEAIITYLGHFHRNLHQIQAIQANYFTVPQILNQFIRGLHSSILQRVRPMHLVDLSTTVTHARDFKAAELKANHAQAVNLVMNRSSDLDSKLKQFSDFINQKLERYLADNCPIYQPPQQHNNQGNKCESVTTVVTKVTLEPIAMLIVIHDQEINIEILITANISTTCILTSSLSTAATGNILTTAVTNNLSDTCSLNTTIQSSSNNIKKPQIKSHLKLEIGNDCPSTNFQLLSTTKWITFLEFRHQNSFNDNYLLTTFHLGAALDTKPITAMYTDAKVDGHAIKLILDSSSADSIIMKQLMDQLAASTRIITADRTTKTPIGEINNFPIEVNSIIIPIKVLVIEATQPLRSCSSTRMADTQEYQQRKTYQVLWANIDHNKLPPILTWDNNDNRKKKQRKEHTWETTIDRDVTNSRLRRKRQKEREKREEDILKNTNTTEELTSGWEKEYSHKLIKEPPYIPLKCKDFVPDEDYGTKTHYYCKPCHCECYGYPKRQGKWDNEPCLECGITFLDEKKRVTLSINRLNGYPHDENKIWQMTNAKIEGVTPTEILKIKNNPPKPVNIVLIPNLNTFLDIEASPKKFHKHYQNLAPTREEQKQHLEKINTQLCDYCLIPCDFQYCNECDLIYNPPPRMIYMIPKEDKPMSNCASESESTFNPNSNFNNNDDENNGFSSTQYGNKNNNNSDSNSNPKIYIALSNLSKEQELKWYSDNNEDIMPECAHNTNAGFDLRYPRKNTNGQFCASCFV